MLHSAEATSAALLWSASPWGCMPSHARVVFCFHRPTPTSLFPSVPSSPLTSLASGVLLVACIAFGIVVVLSDVRQCLVGGPTIAGGASNLFNSLPSSIHQPLRQRVFQKIFGICLASAFAILTVHISIQLTLSHEKKPFFLTTSMRRHCLRRTHMVDELAA